MCALPSCPGWRRQLRPRRRWSRRKATLKRALRSRFRTPSAPMPLPPAPPPSFHQHRATIAHTSGRRSWGGEAFAQHQRASTSRSRLAQKIRPSAPAAPGGRGEVEAKAMTEQAAGHPTAGAARRPAPPGRLRRAGGERHGISSTCVQKPATADRPAARPAAKENCPGPIAPMAASASPRGSTP